MESAREQLSRLRAHDEEAWKLLDSRLRRRLECFFRRRIGSELETDLELAQAALSRASDKIHKFDPERGGSIDQWIFGIARNLFRNRLRTYSRHREVSIDTFVEFLEDEAPDPEHYAETSELREDLQWALDQLSELQRSTFLAFEESGQTLAEIASARKCTVGAVKGALFTARRNLRKHLLAQDPDHAADYAPASIATTRSRRVIR
jgi:RNA polymerase sigma factor (sigma-70 family)